MVDLLLEQNEEVIVLDNLAAAIAKPSMTPWRFKRDTEPKYRRANCREHKIEAAFICRPHYVGDRDRAQLYFEKNVALHGVLKS